jgi:hypothetical protein
LHLTSSSEKGADVTTILVVLLVLLLLGALPAWPYSRSWGYTPSGLLGVLLVILVILVLLGRV